MFWVADRSYLLVGVVASTLTFVVVRRLSVPKQGLLFSDALGLAVFMLIGTAKTLDVTGSGSLAVVIINGLLKALGGDSSSEGC